MGQDNTFPNAANGPDQLFGKKRKRSNKFNYVTRDAEPATAGTKINEARMKQKARYCGRNRKRYDANQNKATKTD